MVDTGRIALRRPALEFPPDLLCSGTDGKEEEEEDPGALSKAEVLHWLNLPQNSPSRRVADNSRHTAQEIHPLEPPSPDSRGRFFGTNASASPPSPDPPPP